MEKFKFSEALKYYREKANMSKSELARRINVSPSYITMLENGEKTNPSLGVQFKIANTLKCSLASLTGENKGIREYVLQTLLEADFSLEEISQKVGVPVSELKNIMEHKPYDNENGAKLLKNLPMLFAFENDYNVKDVEFFEKTYTIANNLQNLINETYYSENLKALKTITTYTNFNLNEKLDSLTIEQIDKLKKSVSDYTEFQLSKILKEKEEE